MDTTRIKRSLLLSAFIVILTAGNFVRITENSNLRAVEVLTILVCGVAIGVFIVNLGLYLRHRKNT